MVSNDLTKKTLPIKLELNIAKTEVYLTLLPPSDEKELQMAEAMDFLTQKSLVGIDKEALKTVIENRQYNKKIVVARGFAPTKGNSAHFLYQFGLEEEGDSLKTVPGQILAVKIPPTLGQPGTTVFGSLISPLSGENFGIIAGNKNVALSKDGTKVYALASGVVCWEGNKVRVLRDEVAEEKDTADSERVRGLTGIDLSKSPVSVVVKAASIEEAKEIGMQILDIPLENLEAVLEVSREELLFRVFFEAGTGYKHWTEELSVLLATPIKRDGLFEFLNTDSGCYLLVTPPLGNGKRVEVSQVMVQLKEKGFLGVNEVTVREAVREATGQPVRIGERQRRPELDGYAKVEVAKDYSEATMVVVPPVMGGYPASYADAMDALREKGVIVGINKEAIFLAIDRRDNRPVVVATAIPPTEGEPARIEYHFRTNRDKLELVEGEDGRIDFKRLNLIENVHKGQILATLIPPGTGIPGKLVNGLETPALPGQETKLPAGRNTDTSPNGLQLIAATSGQVILAGDKKVNVEDTIVIEGDVGLKTGHIYFLGTVIIKGSVLDTFDVEATGDIQIKGSIGKCFISSGGSIAIGEGVKGKKAARLFAGGDIFAKYIEHARVEAKGSIRVTQEIMHSQVDAGKNICLEGKIRGCIIGGLVRAGVEIKAREIGAPAGTKTLVEVGGSPRVRQELATLEKAFESDLDRKEKIEKNLQVLNAKKIAAGKLLAEDLLKYNRLTKQCNRMTIRLERYLYQKDFLETKIRASTEGIVKISEILFAGVTVVVQTARMEIKRDYRAVSIGFKDDLIEIM